MRACQRARVCTRELLAILAIGPVTVTTELSVHILVECRRPERLPVYTLATSAIVVGTRLVVWHVPTFYWFDLITSNTFTGLMV